MLYLKPNPENPERKNTFNTHQNVIMTSTIDQVQSAIKSLAHFAERNSVSPWKKLV